MYRMLVIASLALFSGCAPIVISDALATSKSRQHFTSTLEGTNLARRTQGLPELDTCSERYWFDHAWAMQDKLCAARIHRWELGDSTALNPAGMVLARTRLTIPEAEQHDYDRRWQRRADSIWTHKAP